MYFEGLLEYKDEIKQRTRAQRVDEKMGPFVEFKCLFQCIMFRSVKYIFLHAKDNNFKPVKGAFTTIFCHAYQTLAIKGIGVGGLGD